MPVVVSNYIFNYQIDELSFEDTDYIVTVETLPQTMQMQSPTASKYFSTYSTITGIITSAVPRPGYLIAINLEKR